jgi:hypothetical protein
MKIAPEKPVWVNALEESLLLAIGLFALVTWIVAIALLSN